MVGWTKYDAYGLPIAMPQRDFNSDTFANDQDYFDFVNDYNGGAGSWNPGGASPAGTRYHHPTHAVRSAVPLLE